MKKTILLSAMGLLSALGSVAGAQEIGRVLSSTPVVQQVAVPRQVCGPQQYVQPPSTGGGAVVGAIVGGLLGNTIGHGMGRAAATGLGVIAGAAVGDSVETRGYPQAVPNCTTQTGYENRTVGYSVVYEYAGRQYNVQLPYDPGPTIRLQVTPMSGPAYDTPAPQAQAPFDDGSGVVVAPPVAPVAGQPVARVIATPDSGAYPAYPAAYPAYPPYPAYPRYYAPYYPPIGISLGIGYTRHSHRWR